MLYLSTYTLVVFLCVACPLLATDSAPRLDNTEYGANLCQWRMVATKLANGDCRVCHSFKGPRCTRISACTTHQKHTECDKMSQVTESPSPPPKDDGESKGQGKAEDDSGVATWVIVLILLLCMLVLVVVVVGVLFWHRRRKQQQRHYANDMDMSGSDHEDPTAEEMPDDDATQGADIFSKAPTPMSMGGGAPTEVTRTHNIKGGDRTEVTATHKLKGGPSKMGPSEITQTHKVRQPKGAATNNYPMMV